MDRQMYNSNKLLHVCALKCIAMLEFVRAIHGAPTLHYGGIPTMLRKQARTLCSQSVQQQSARANTQGRLLRVTKTGFTLA